MKAIPTETPISVPQLIELLGHSVAAQLIAPTGGVRRVSLWVGNTRRTFRVDRLGNVWLLAAERRGR